MTWLASDDTTPPRVAYAVGTAVGGAVTRNRVRRRLQAGVASVAPDLGPGTYLVGAAPGAAGASFAELASSLVDALVALPAPGGLSERPSAYAGGLV